VDRAPAGGEAVYRLTTHVGHGKDTQVAGGGIQDLRHPRNDTAS
jgi:hypothetical protein